MKFLKTCLFLAFTPLFFANHAVGAVVINVDINGGSTNTYSGQGGYSDPGNNTWNGLNIGGGGNYTTTVTSGALVNSAGGASSVLLTLNGVRGFDYTSYGGGVLAAGNALIDDVSYTTNGQSAPPIPGFTFAPGYIAGFRLSGLTPGASYNLYLFGSSGIDPKPTDFNVNSTVQSVTGRNSAVTPAIFTQGTDYVIYNSITADGSGYIDGYFKGHNLTGDGVLSGLQVVAVPEPTTLALLACGSLLLVLRHKFRQRELIA